MAGITDIRDGLATRLRTIGAPLNVYDEWPDQVVPPAVLVRPASAQYEQTFGADWTSMQLECLVVVTTKGGLKNAELALEPYISNTGASSLRAAIAGDRSLGGNVKYTFIRGWRNYDVVDVNGMELLSAVVEVDCELS